MTEKRTEPQSLTGGELWGFSEEPAYGYHPMQAFRASYKFRGQIFRVVIQGFVKKGSISPITFRYRVTYENGDEKLLAYVLGTGFVEECGTHTAHARKLAACIGKHFSKA